MKPVWHILTGEYPSAPGGVSDYTRTLAKALAAEGEDVEVWAPETRGALVSDRGVTTHALPDVFGPLSLPLLTSRLSGGTRPRRLLVQYVPHAFGMKGMNVPFCGWIAARRHDEVWIMFHEVATPWGGGRPWRQQVLGAVTRVMASLLSNRADHTFVSVPAWNDMLRGLLPRPRPSTWLPIPSNIPSDVVPAQVERVRAQISREDGATIIGHFGTYGAILTPLLAEVFAAILAAPEPRTLLLLGRGAAEFARVHLAGQRVVAVGELSVHDVASHLAACDLVVQPYVDGVSSRRTSVMASLALGVPVVTNEGALSEDLWRQSGAVALAPAPSAALIAGEVDRLSSDRDRARDLGVRGKALYEREFSLSRTSRTLRSF